MKAFLYGISAIEALRAARARRDRLHPAPFGSLPQDCVASLRGLAGTDLKRHGLSGSHIHLLVPTRAGYRRSNSLTAHVSGRAYVPGSFLQIGDGLYAPVPELALTQLAGSASLTTVMEVAFELCGTYALNRRAPRGFKGNLAPLLEKEQALKRLKLLAGIPGAGQAAKAIGHALPGSASPMETALAMLAVLPRRLGGRNLPGCELNRPVEFSPSAVQAAGFRTCYCDLYWDGIDIEYDGRDHDSASQQRHDRRRDNALACMGIRVLRLKADDIFDLSRLNAAFDMVARHIGARNRTTLGDFPTRQEHLHCELLGYRRR